MLATNEVTSYVTGVVRKMWTYDKNTSWCGINVQNKETGLVASCVGVMPAFPIRGVAISIILDHEEITCEQDLKLMLDTIIKSDKKAA